MFVHARVNVFVVYLLLSVILFCKWLPLHPFQRGFLLFASLIKTLSEIRYFVLCTDCNTGEEKARATTGEAHSCLPAFEK